MKSRVEQFSRRKKPKPGEVVLAHEDRFDDEEEAYQKPIRFELIFRILSFLKPHRKQLYILIALIVTATVLGVR